MRRLMMGWMCCGAILAVNADAEAQIVGKIDFINAGVDSHLAGHHVHGFDGFQDEFIIRGGGLNEQAVVDVVDNKADCVLKTGEFPSLNDYGGYSTGGAELRIQLLSACEESAAEHSSTLVITGLKGGGIGEGAETAPLLPRCSAECGSPFR